MKSKKFIKRIVSFLTIICCLAGSALVVKTVRAEEETPRAVFTNEPNEAPDLYITKELQNPESYNGNPDDLRFSFTLRLDGKPANRQEYTIIKDGEEEKEDGRVKVYRTESGRFTLSPGETAWFRNLTVGTRYEVTEDNIPESFLQAEPEGGAAATGIITAKGESRRFINRYVPNTHSKTTTLTVSKTITFPYGYTAPETPEFEFVLTIDGEPYGMEAFTITDDRTGKHVGTDTTDADGKFKLKGGYTALFTKIKTGVDYKLEEINLPEGWRATGSTVLEGATKAPETPLVMNNAAAAFAVSKQMKDNSQPDVDFTFLLTREDKSVWAGARYYLYSLSTGELIEEPEKDTPSGRPEEEQTKFENPARTKEDGTFTLKPGQTAVFVGIEPETVYSVREVGNPNYTQTLPAGTEGYKDYVVTDNVIVLPFENQFMDNRGSLTVTKKVENMKGDAPEGQETFTFKLTEIKAEEGAQSGPETPVANAVYSVASGGSTATFKTNAQGEFTIKADETTRFGSLSFGKYKVEEIHLPEGYQIDKAVQIKDLTRDNSAVFIFSNEYRADKLDLYLIKQNRREESLPDVSFILWKAKGEAGEDARWEDIEKTEVGTYSTDSEGRITIPGLETGIYYLQETKAAVGYMPWEKPLRIEITRNPEDRSKVTIQAEDRTASIPAEALPDGYLEDENPDIGGIPRGSVVKTLTLTQHEDARDVAELTVINEMFYELPNSGGMGIFPCILPGVVLMLAACMLYFRVTGLSRSAQLPR